MALAGRLAPERTVLRMTGAEAREVLQSVVTNDVGRVAEDRLVYAALLTPQGKYLFDFFLFADGADVLIDVAADRAAPFGQRLSLYCLRRDARLAGPTDLQVAQVWGGVPEGPRVLADPRDPELGHRVYGPDLSGLDLVGDEADWTALRVARGVPETGVELLPEQTYPLEAGFERLAGVDFRKGCYVGQEVTARMKHKAELRKGLVRVRLEGEAAPGTPVTAGGRPVGTLFSAAGGLALAHLRLDRATGSMEAGSATVHRLP